MRADALLTIPHKPEFERNILGVLVLSPERIGEAAEVLDASDFFTSLYRKIYRAVLDLEGAGRPVEVITIHEALAQDKELADSGGIGFLAKLSDGLYRRAPLRDYCRAVKEAAALRRVLATCESTTAQISEGRPSAEVFEFVATNFDAIRDENRALDRGPVRACEVLDELQPVIERAADGKSRIMGVPTGFSDIDRLTAGWQSGDYCILAARPSVGKTALAIEFALRQLKAGNPVAFFSLEMSRQSILLRMACREAGVDSQILRRGRLSRDDFKNLVDAFERIRTMLLWIDDSAGLRASDLRWRLRSLAKRHGIKFAVMDYLQLLRSDGKDRFERVTNSSLELGAGAKELGQLSGGTLLALSQLNRAGAADTPRLEHLRESGQLEQDGDVVFLLYDAEHTENGQAQPSTKVLEIAKQRNGPCGDVRLTFLPAVGRFEMVLPDFTEPSEGELWQTEKGGKRGPSETTGPA